MAITDIELDEIEQKLEAETAKRVEAEQAILQSASRLRSILWAAPVGIGVVRDRVILEVNERLCEMTGYLPDELIGQNARILYPTDEDFEYVGREKYKQIQQNGTGTVQTVWKRKNGEIFEVLLSSTPIDPTDFSVGITFTALDLSSIKHEVIEKQQEQIRLNELLLDSIPHFAMLIRKDKIVLSANRIAREAGVKIGGFCWRDFMRCEFIPLKDQKHIRRTGKTPPNGTRCTFCQADEALKERTAKNNPNLKAWGKVWDTHWIPLDEEVYLHYTVDVTKRTDIEDALRKSEEKYRSLFNNMLNGFAYCKMVCDKNNKPVDWIYLDVNNAFEKITGLKDVVGKKATEVLPGIKEDVPKLFDIYGKVASTGKEARFEIYLNTLQMWFSVNAYSPQKDYFVAVIEDIADRKRSEEALKSALFFTENLIDTANVIVLTLDTQANITLFNKYAERLTGYAKNEVLGKNWFELFVPENDAKLIQGVFKDALNQMPEGLTYINSIITKKGEERLISWSNNIIKNPDGSITGVLAIGMDITEQKQVEIALRASEEKFRDLINNIGDGIGLVDENETFIFTNPAADRIFGMKPGELKGKNLSDFVDATTFQLIQQKTFLRQNDFRDSYDIEIVRPDGNKRQITVTANPKYDETGRFVGTFGVFKDVTEMKVIQQKVLSSLREKEILLEEIHHRVKNNLQLISSLLNLQAQQSAGKTPTEILRECQDRVRSIALIHERLYQSPDFTSINWRDYVSSIVDHLYNSYNVNRDKISLKIEMEDVTFNINHAIPCALIINELVSNAFKYAFPDGLKGKISIAMKRIDENQLCISVSDNGIGLPKNVDLQKTNTLGLQIVRTLANQIGSQLQIIRNNGTEFKIILKN